MNLLHMDVDWGSTKDVSRQNLSISCMSILSSLRFSLFLSFPWIQPADSPKQGIPGFPTTLTLPGPRVVSAKMRMLFAQFLFSVCGFPNRICMLLFALKCLFLQLFFVLCSEFMEIFDFIAVVFRKASLVRSYSAISRSQTFVFKKKYQCLSRR